MNVFLHDGVIVVQCKYEKFCIQEDNIIKYSFVFYDIYKNCIAVTEDEYQEFRTFMLLNNYTKERYAAMCILKHGGLTQANTWKEKLARIITNISRIIG
jgi:hypothetical protein